MGGDAVSRHDERQLLGRLLHIQGEVESLDRQIARTNRLATLGTITGMIAHELNNILTPVLSYAQLALKEPEDEGLRQKALQHALEGSQRASDIVSAILGFVRDTGQEEIAKVDEVAQEALRCLARDPKRDGCQFYMDIQPGCTVAMAPVLLVQILVNLILNAQQSMRQGKGRLELRAWTGDDSAVLIAVADNGCGIEAELLPRIFDPFVTYRNRPNAADIGTGLGLTVCKRIVEEAGGVIEVDSTVGQGTTFTVRLVAGSTKVADSAPEPAAERDVA